MFHLIANIVVSCSLILASANLQKAHIYINLITSMHVRLDKPCRVLTPCVCVLSRFNHIQLFVTPWTVARQDPLSMGFSRQEHFSGLPWPSAGDLPDPGIEPRVLYHSHLLGSPYQHFSSFFSGFIHLLTVLGLGCCAGLSLVAASRGYSPVAMTRLLMGLAYLVAEHGL